MVKVILVGVMAVALSVGSIGSNAAQASQTESIWNAGPYSRIAQGDPKKGPIKPGDQCYQGPCKTESPDGTLKMCYGDSDGNCTDCKWVASSTCPTK